MIKVNDTDLQQPMVFDGDQYTQVNVGDEVVWRLTPIRNQTKNVTVISNTTGTGMTITYDSGYTGLEEVNLVVNVPQTGGTVNNQTKYVNFTGNTATTVTYDTGYTGLESVGIIVNVPERELRGLTATTNGSYSPSGFDGYSAVTVNVQAPAPETSGVTYSSTQFGMQTFPTPLSSVTFIQDASMVIDDWNDVSAATTVSDFSWNPIYMRGYNAEDDTFPYYTLSDKCPMVQSFSAQLPYAGNLTGFLEGHPYLQTLGLRDLGLAIEDDHVNLTEVATNCTSLQRFQLNHYYTPISGPKRFTFDRAFAGCTAITTAHISIRQSNLQDENYYRGMFSGCTSLSEVSGFNFPCQSIEDTLGMFDDCTSLTTLSLILINSCPSMNNTTNPVYNKPNLETFLGIPNLGMEFTPGGDHVFDISASTGLTSDSLEYIISSLGLVPSDVTDAQFIIGPTNVAKLTSQQIIDVAYKNWHLS